MDIILNRKLRDPLLLYSDIISKINNNEIFYILLDEIQFVEDFSELMNSLNQLSNVDVYVTVRNQSSYLWIF